MTYKEFEAMTFGDVFERMGEDEIADVDGNIPAYVNVGGADLPIKAVYLSSEPGTDDDRSALCFETGHAPAQTDTRLQTTDTEQVARDAAVVIAPIFHLHGWRWSAPEGGTAPTFQSRRWRWLAPEGGTAVPNVPTIAAAIRQLFGVTPLDDEDPGEWTSGRISVKVIDGGYDRASNTRQRRYQISVIVGTTPFVAIPVAEPPSDDGTPGTKDDWRNLSRAYEKLLVSYRTGRAPSSKTLRTIDTLKSKLGEQ